MFQSTTELGIRGLVVLLALRGDGPVQSREIASRLGVSPGYVTQAFQPLARMGWLHSMRGRTGGWELTVDPKTVTLADVVRALEPDEQWRRCVIGLSICSPDDPCPLHEAWGEARGRITDALEKTTLDELWRFAPGSES